MTAFNTPCQVADRSIASATGAAQQAIGFNGYRTFLMLQAPSAAAVTFSFTNPNVAAGAVGCFTLAAGQIQLFGPVVPNAPLYVIGTLGNVISILEG